MERKVLRESLSGTASERGASGAAPLLILLVLTALFSGCGAANQELKTRDPQELYSTALTAYQADRFDEAEKTFKTLLEEHPLSPHAFEAELMLGDVSFAAEKYEEAVSYYTSFVALHPGHPRAPYALFQKGMSLFKDVLSIDRDQTSTRKALFSFEDLTAAYPDSPYAGKARELIGFLKRRLAESEMYVARFYFKGRNYKGALARFRDILKNYPEAGLTDETLYYIGESYINLGEDKLARDAFTTLITDFPESPYVKSAREKLKEG